MKFVSKIPASVEDAVRNATVPWGPVGYVTYKRTYARMRADLGRSEEWADTALRGIQALLDYGMAVTEGELADLADAWVHLKGIPAGRGLWQLGTDTVRKVGSDSLQNCWYAPLSTPEAFCFLFDELMLGGGVGFSVMPSHVHKLPPVKRAAVVTRKDTADVDFLVPDNRQGWVELLRRVLAAFFETGKDFTYSCQAVRSKGAPIAGFGGTASGPEELSAGVGRIAAVLGSRAGKHVRPIDALDIANIIGSVVVAGNVRRSAQIAIGHVEDADFLSAKRWDLGGIPNWRAMSNNTVGCGDTSRLPDSFWLGYEGTGEPYGLFNLDLSRSHGRLADGPNYREDRDVEGVNPCAEQTLAPWECCCLVEQMLPNIRDLAEFHRVASAMYKVAKTMISLPLAWPKTREVVEKNRRVGISVTGVAQSSFGKDDYSSVYRHLEELDRDYSRLKGVNRSIKLTTVKPSGTVSLLAGVTPGVHPAYAQQYIRRIRFASDDPLADRCRRNGYHVEPVVGFDGKADPNTLVAEFPVRVPEGTLLASRTTAVRQLELQKSMQTYWSDNAVSVTVYYRKEELPAVKGWLAENYRQGIKTTSFLLHSEHGFRQAPYEEISRERYEELAARARPVTSLTETEERELADSTECRTGACPVK